MYKLLIIAGTLPNLNDYTKACRANKFMGANLKKEVEDVIRWRIRQQLKDVSLNSPVRLAFKWYEPNKKRDLDNICFAKKFILDSLVKEGIIQGDGWRDVIGFTDSFYVSENNPRVEVVIDEVNDYE